MNEYYEERMRSAPFAAFMFIGSIVMSFILILLVCTFAHAQLQPAMEGTASYYTVKSCLKESGQYTMANGSLLDDSKFTAASWDFKFGTMLKVTNLENGKSCIVKITDRGPARRLYNKGRILDLSLAGFSALADYKKGIIKVRIEKL